MRKLVVLVLLLLTLVTSSPLHLRSLAQDGDTCPEFVASVFTDLEAVCVGLGRDRICYGHHLLTAEPHPDAESFVFESEGDLENVGAIQSLQLSAYDGTEETWGIAVMQLQATLLNSQPDNVTLLLFGNVEIENAGVSVPRSDVTITASNGLRVRSAPDSSANNVLTSLPAETVVTGIGRLADNSWLQVALPDGTTGWVSGEFVTVEGDLETLQVVEAAEAIPYHAPMQAFYLQTGADDRPCGEAPDSGLLIQTPDGAGEITFLINEVTIDLGSTAYLQINAQNEMVASVIEGRATVTVDATTVIVPAGSRVRIPLQNSVPTGDVFGPEPYDQDELSALPVVALPEEVEVATPLTEEEIAAASVPPSSGTTPGGTSPSGSFFPVAGIYNLVWSAGVSNQGQFTVIEPGVSFTMLILGGNPSPIPFTLVGGSTYASPVSPNSGLHYVFTFTSSTTFTGQIGDTTVTGVFAG